jgi:hypothetical protein
MKSKSLEWRALRDLNAGLTGPEPVALSILGQGPMT